jgi:hypothetical protein
MAFMGGQAAKAYHARGFEQVASWVDAELKTLARERDLIPSGLSPDEAAQVSCCVRRL